MPDNIWHFFPCPSITVHCEVWQCLHTATILIGGHFTGEQRCHHDVWNSEEKLQDTHRTRRIIIGQQKVTLMLEQKATVITFIYIIFYCSSKGCWSLYSSNGNFKANREVK